MAGGKQHEMIFKLNAQANSGFKSTFTQAQAEFARLGSEIQSLNRVQADISAYQKQQSAIESTSKKLESLHRQQELLKQQIEETNKAGESTVALKRDEERLSESIRSTTVRLENQQDRLGATTLRLKEAGVSTKDLSGESARLSAQIGELSKRQEQAAESAQSYKDRAVDAFSAAGEALAAAGILAGIKEIGEAYIGTVQAAGEFGATMSNVQALSGANAREMAALNAQAKELGATTKFTAMESGEAMGYMGMAGWNARQMLSGMPGVLDLAAASGEDLAGVADIVTDSLTGFKLTAADTGEFVDVLATAASKSNTNVSMLGESFKYVAPLAGTLGYTAEDTAVALGLMANSGIKASQAGTTLRTAITNLASPTKEQAAEMERLGISLTDTNGQMLPMIDMVGNLRGAFSGMSEAEQSAAASTIFGREAMSGMLAIINASESDYQSLTQSIYNSAGAAKRMADIKLDNLAGDLTLLSSAADGLSLTIGEEFMLQTRALVQAGTGVISFVNELIDDHPVLTKAILGAAGAVGVLTAGVVAYNAAQKVMAAVNLAALFTGPVGPILAVGAAFGAVAAGIIGAVEAANEGVPKVEELTQAARALDDTVSNATGGFEKSRVGILAAANSADHYIDRLEKLEGIAHRTEEQQGEYHATLVMLSETIPELAESINLETDYIEGGTAALREQTAAWEENAKAQAYQESLKEIYAAQAEAELERQKSVILLTDAQADLRDIEEKRFNLERRMRSMEGVSDEYLELESRWLDLGVEYDEVKGKVDAYKEAVADSDNVLREAESTTDSYKRAMEALTPAVDDAETATSRAADTNAALWDSMESVRDRAAALAEAYGEAYEAAYSSVSGQYDLWDEAAQVSVVSAGTIIESLESQAGYWQDYNQNLESLRARAGDVRGLGEVIASFADGSSESVNAVAGMAQATDGDLAQMVENWKKLQKEHDTTSDSLAEFKTDFIRQMDELGQELQTDIEGMDYSAESGRAARSTMDSYIGEIDAALPRVQAAINRLRGSVAAGLGSISAAGAPVGMQRALGLNGYASGTENAERGFAMVGEDGPEVVFFRGGEQVLNARETAAMQARPAMSALPAGSYGPGGVVITLSPVYNLSGGMSAAGVREELERHNEGLRELILEVIEDARIDSARRRG